jgi:predicted molibdopterin-dependent oxidoreductase YjgC
MTRRTKAIEAVAGAPYVEMNAADASRLSVASGERVVVRSRRGAITLAVKVSRRTDRGVVFIPFHFREAAANVLTSSIALDPICKIPELKVATVQIEKL